MTEEERGDKAFLIHTAIVNNEKLRRELIAQNAKFLHDMQEDNLYKAILGDGVEGEWAGYLADLSLYYTRSKVFALTTLYKRLTVKLGIKEDVWAHVPLTRLMDALPVITAENWQTWFEKALVLTTKDWNIELRQAKGLPTEEDEAHEHNMDTYQICKTCGKREKIHVPHDHDADSMQEELDEPVYTSNDDTEEIAEGVIKR
jgi:hypothetical protein